MHVNSCGWETRFLTALLPHVIVHHPPRAGGYAVGNIFNLNNVPAFCQPLRAVLCGEDVASCDSVRDNHKGLIVWGAPQIPFALVVLYNRGYERRMPPISPPTVQGVAYVQGNCVAHREQAAATLSRAVNVFAYGKCRGGGNVKLRRFRRSFPALVSDPHSPYRTHAFALTMEHANQRGYCTEKAIIAAAAGAIPIYMGDSTALCELLNCDRVVLWNDSAPALVASLMANRSEYMRMWNLPRLRVGGAQRALKSAQSHARNSLPALY